MKEQVLATPNWKALTSLFRADSRNELVTLLGFSEDIANRVSEAVERLKVTVVPSPITKSLLPAVTFVEPNQTPVAETIEIKPTPSERSTSTTSDVTDVTKSVDGELTIAPSLFDDDIGMPHTQEADFFGTIGTLCGTIPDHVQIPRRSFVQHSSVAVTFSSRPSSAASESLKGNTFRIYPSEESESGDECTSSRRLRAAISFCLSTKRYTNAILLTVNKGPDSKGLL